MPELLAPADYQPAQAVLATRCLARLRLWLPQARLEEVGASSIPGAWSKGDLDLMAAVSATEFEDRREALVAHGYVEKQGTLRTPELCMLEWREGPEAHALQLVAAGSEFEALFLTLRDRLRASPALLAQYNAVKQAHRADSDADYRAAKALFIAAVLAGSTLAQAEDFAAVLAAEQSVWEALRRGDAEADLARLRPDFLGVYASGLSDRAGHAAALAQGPSVQHCALSEPCWRAAAPGVVLISYLAHWRRAGSELEEAMRVSSLWLRDTEGGWRNQFSQDTPCEPLVRP